MDRSPAAQPRRVWLAGLSIAALALLALPQIGCLMPCGAVRDDADQRYEEMSQGIRRMRDPGGDRYDLTLHVPAGLFEASVAQLLDSGVIQRTHRQAFDLPVPGAPQALSATFRADLEEVRLQLVPGAPARVQAHLVLRLRGEAQQELFDLRATVDGPVELTTRTPARGQPTLLLRMGDLRRSELALDGTFLGNAFSSVLEGLIPGGALGSVLDAIGAGGALPSQVEESIEEAARQHATDLVGQLLADEIGDVPVFELQPLEVGGLPLQPRALALATGDGWAALGVRTNLNSGFGTLPLRAPPRGLGDRVQIQAGAPFVAKAIEAAYVDGIIPRTLDEAGAPAAGTPDREAPYRIEPLGIELGPETALCVRVYRCEEPCGWADLRARITPAMDGHKALSITADDIEVTASRGVGNIAELALRHRERVVGEPLEVVQSMSSVLRLDVAGQPLELTIDGVEASGGALALRLDYELDQGKGGKAGKGGKSGKSGKAGKGGKAGPGEKIKDRAKKTQGR